MSQHGQTSSTHVDSSGNLKAGGKNQNQDRGQAGPTNSGKYVEDEGYMRGARIAEKIQEYYHTNSNMGVSASNQASNFVNQSNGSVYTNGSKQKQPTSVDGVKVIKQFVQYQGPGSNSHQK